MGAVKRMILNIYFPVKKQVKKIIWPLSNIIFLLIAFFTALIFRFKKNKPFDVGIGPMPMINNVHHKKALERYGYKTETFVTMVYFITREFDYIADQKMPKFFYEFFPHNYMFYHAVSNYRCLYFYFDGCIFGRHRFLSRFEPFLYRLARMKLVVMPYGSDIDEMSRSRNYSFKHAVSMDYPGFRTARRQVHKNIDRWTIHADHIISGCEWVDFLYHWDTLMLAHFTVDTEKWTPVKTQAAVNDRPFRILHAPNHRTIKGTRHFENAVSELKKEGLNIELVIRQQVPNDELRNMISSVDVVADQLIMGWYAMFAIEAMSMEKPVLCYIKKELENLYIEAGLLEKDEIPLVRCSPFNVKEVLRDLYITREKLGEIGKRSREFVIKHHSVEYVGSVFDKINRKIGLNPSMINKV